jgi:hypothetical protein
VTQYRFTINLRKSIRDLTCGTFTLTGLLWWLQNGEAVAVRNIGDKQVYEFLWIWETMGLIKGDEPRNNRRSTKRSPYYYWKFVK